MGSSKTIAKKCLIISSDPLFFFACFDNASTVNTFLEMGNSNIRKQSWEI